MTTPIIDPLQPLADSLFPKQKALPKPTPLNLYVQDKGTAGASPEATARATHFYDQQDMAQLQSSVDLAHTTTPDTHAQVLKLADRTGLPIDFIQRNPDMVQREADRIDFNAEQFRQTSPALADWLRDPDHAMVSGDDHSVLQHIELNIRSIGQAVARGTGKGAAQEELVPLSAQAARAVIGLDPNLTPVQAARRTALQQQMATSDSLSADPTRGNAPFAAEQIAYQGRQLITTAKAGGVPAMLGAAAGTAFAGAAGQPELIPAAARAGAGAGLLVGGFKYSFDAEMGFAFDEYQQMVDEKGQPMDPKVAAYAAMGVGAVNALLETVGETALLKLLPGVKSLLGAGGLTGTAATKQAVREALLKPTVRTALLEVGKEWVKAASIESLTEMAQEVSAIIGREASKGASGQVFAPEPAGSYVQRVRDVGVQTAIGALGVGAALSVPGAVHETRAVREAKQVTEAFKALGEQVGESKLAARLPEAFQDFVARAKAEGPVENVYVPIDAWQTLFQSNPGAAAGAATEVLGSPEQYTEAVATGGDLVIPLEAYAAKIAGTPLNDRLLPDIRLHQGSLSLRDAEEQAKQMEGVAGPIPDAPVLTPEQKAAETFQTGLEVQLRETGATPSDAETQAQIPTAFFRTLGTRLGQSLFERYRVSVARREVVAAAPTGAAVPHEIPALAEGAKRKPIAKQSAVELYDHLFYTQHRLQNAEIPTNWAREDLGVMRTGGAGILGSIVTQGQETFDKIFERLKSLGQTDDQIWNMLDEIQAQRDERAGLQVEQAKGGRGQGLRSPDVPFAPGATVLFQRNPQLAGPTNAELLGTAPKGDENGTPAERELFKAWTKLNKIDQKEVGRRSIVDPAELAVARQHLLDAETNIQREKDGLPPVQTPVTLPDVPGPGGPTLAEFTAEMQARLGEAGLRQENKGAIQFSGPGPIREFNISLLPTADRSTFLHELGHLFLEVTSDVASGADVPEQVATDMQTIRDWLGNDGTPFTEAQHEQFARGIEAYLLEGKAPSASLRTAFARFRTWLVSIYREIRNLNVTLTPEVTSVMDRLLATDDEIAAARQAQDYRPMDQVALGATKAEYTAYTRATDRATTGAQDELMARLMAEERRNSKAWWQAEEDRTRAEVSAELESDPAYQAIHYLKRGESLTGEALPVAEDGKPVKLSKGLLVQRYGKDILSELPRGLYAAVGGADPDQVAHLFGFDSGDNMIPALISKRGAPLNLEIERQTAARMAAQYPDLLRDSAALARAAQDAVHSGAQSEVLLTELRLLGRQLGIRLPPRIDALRQQAAELVGRNRVRDLAPYAYQQAEAKNARLAEQAGRKGDLPAAHEFKRKQLLNHLAFRTATDLQEQATKDAAYLHAQDTPASRQAVGKAGGSFLEQRDKLLERFDFKNRSLRAVDRSTRLAQWIDEQTELGRPPDLSAAMQDEAFATNWKNLTPGQLSDLREAVEQINHLARTANKALADQRAADLKERADESVVSLKAFAKRTFADPLGGLTPFERAQAGAEGIVAVHQKLGSLVRIMDGQQDNGAMFRNFLVPVNEAQNTEAVRLNAELGGKTDAIFNRYYTREDLKELAGMHRAIVPGAPEAGMLSKADRLMIVLNAGTDDNLLKLIDGSTHRLNESSVQAIIDSLDKRDMDFVQAILDQIGSYWEEIAAKQKRVVGVVPEKVEARVIHHSQFGDYKGGYFPIIYDASKNQRAYENQIATEAREMKQGGYVARSTRRDHTKARVGSAGLPLRLDLSAIYRHQMMVIHDLTHHEMLIDVNRFLRNPDIRSTIQEHYGAAVYRQIVNGVNAIAAGNNGPITEGEKFASYLRQGATGALLGYNLATAAVQPVGLFNSMVRLGDGNSLKGAYWVQKGMAQWMQAGASGQEHTFQWIKQKSPFMDQRISHTMRDQADGLQRLSALSRFSDLKAGAFSFIGRAQLLADIPTWLGGYAKAYDTLRVEDYDSAEAMDHQAVLLADQAVKDSQGGGLLVDQAGIERGNVYQKMFTTFYTYANTVLQQNIELVHRTDFGKLMGKGSLGAFLADFLLLNVVPIVITGIIRAAMGGAPPDKDKIQRDIYGSLLNQFIILRELSSVVQTGQYQGPAGIKIVTATAALAVQTAQAWRDKETDAAFWRSLNIEGGLLFHYPALQLQRTAEGANALFSGKTRNPFALVGGAPR